MLDVLRRLRGNLVSGNRRRKPRSNRLSGSRAPEHSRIILGGRTAGQTVRWFAMMDRTEAREKMMAAWRGVAKRMIESGCEPSDIFQTMALAGLTGMSEHAKQDPPISDLIAPMDTQPPSTGRVISH